MLSLVISLQQAPKKAVVGFGHVTGVQGEVNNHCRVRKDTVGQMALRLGPKAGERST